MDRVCKDIPALSNHCVLRISQYGIEFGYVGGDPAELMRICVENGTFTIAFLKEGVQKVSLHSI